MKFGIRVIGVTWRITLCRRGWGTKLAMGISNFILRRSRIRKRGKIVWNQSLIYRG